jgi:hypothetical protein
MTFLEIQDRVMDRLNLTSQDARDRIKDFINERNRNVCTSVNLGRVRRTTITSVTTSGVRTLVPSGIIKPLTITIPAQRRVLDERTSDQLRNLDAGEDFTGIPELYAISKYALASFELELSPTPDGAYDLTIDGIARGVDLSDDADEPGFPEDFHDILVFGTLADEFDHIGDEQHIVQAERQEKKFQKRLGELRLWIQKTIYLRRGQNVFNDPWEWYFFGTQWYTP